MEGVSWKVIQKCKDKIPLTKIRCMTSLRDSIANELKS